MDALRSYLINSEATLRGMKELEKSTAFLGVIAGCVLITLVWASVFHIDRVVRVDGKVIPTGHSRPVQHLEGGIVSSIDTSEGESVHQGDLLLTIDNTTAGASLNEGKIKLTSLQAKAARLKAEAAMANELVFPSELAGTEASNQERNLFLARKNKLTNEIRVHQETIRQHTAALHEAENRKNSLSGEVSVAQKRSQMLETMAAHKAASQIELLEAQSRERRLDTEIKDAENAKPKLQAALAAEQARVSALSSDFRTEAQNELVNVMADIDRLNQTMSAVADRYNRTEVRSPIDGTINRLSVTSVGSVVKPGETLVEITPLAGDMLIEARVPPKDRGELRAGISAKLRVSAYDAAELGVLTGEVSEISADTMLDHEGVAYYRAKIHVGTVPPAYLAHPVLPGMTITGDLVTGRRTVLAHLLSPLRKFTNNMFRDSR